MQKITKNKKPWPTKDAMIQVYDENLWGSNGDLFYSGDGSHDMDIVVPYIKEVVKFLKSFIEPISVCDLGCGDFNVGRQLIKYSKKYVGVDIVPDLIKFNKKKFETDSVRFRCLDIAKEPLPSAKCVIVRQVLQHLSNIEVKKVLNKLTTYKYVILTEHIPEGEFVPNVDIISGQGIRLKKHSGLDITQEPFLYSTTSMNEILNLKPQGYKGKIVTWLIRND